MPARAPRSRFGQDKKGGGREGGAAVVQEMARAWPEGLRPGRCGHERSGLGGKSCGARGPADPASHSSRVPAGKAGNGDREREQAIV